MENALCFRIEDQIMNWNVDKLIRRMLHLIGVAGFSAGMLGIVFWQIAHKVRVRIDTEFASLTLYSIKHFDMKFIHDFNKQQLATRGWPGTREKQAEQWPWDLNDLGTYVPGTRTHHQLARTPRSDARVEQRASDRRTSAFQGQAAGCFRGRSEVARAPSDLSPPKVLRSQLWSTPPLARWRLISVFHF